MMHISTTRCAAATLLASPASRSSIRLNFALIACNGLTTRANLTPLPV